MLQKSLHFELDYFFDLKRQIAIKRFTHKKFWNVVLHSLTSWVIAWCGIYIQSCIFPFFIQLFNIICIISICIIQDVSLGLVSLPGFLVIFYHATYLTSMTILQTLSLAMLIGLLQIFVGQKWIEGSEPFSGPNKSNSALFAVCDVINDIFIAPFHFMVTLGLRLDLREDIRWQSDTELRKIMSRMQPAP